MVGFFKKIKMRVTKPKAKVFIALDRNVVGLGEELTGTLHVTSEEEFDADEVRVEVKCWSRTKNLVHTKEGWEEKETTQILWSTKERVCGRLHLTPRYKEEFPFKVKIPHYAPPTSLEPDRRIRWEAKGVIAVKKRPDVTTKSIGVEVVRWTTPTVTAPPLTTKEAQTPSIQAVKPIPTNCTRCGAPLDVTREDVIITCRYCGNTIVVATREEIKKHSMIENKLHPQEAVDIAKEYMDKGVLRRGVAEKAQITGVRLRYIPFWIFPAYAETYYTGRRGLGVSELREIKHAVTDERKKGWVKLGKVLKAAAELAIEGYVAYERGPTFRRISRTISRQYDWTVLARRAVLSDVKYYEVPLERKIPFDPGRIPSDAEFFNTELNEEEAKDKVKAEVEIKQRELVSEEVDTIETCHTRVRVGEGELLHAPVWFVHYKLGERDYAVAVDGSTGKVLGGGRPLIKLI